jgi:tetratricopeptide (TPR) repeat protein
MSVDPRLPESPAPSPRESLQEAPPVPSRPRGSRRRLLGRLLVLLLLLALTAWNVTRSEALAEARTAYQRGHLVRALAKSLDHLKRRPWSREASLLAARCFSQLDFADDAEPYYRRAGRLSLDDLQLRALAIVRSNQRDRAVEAYREILARWPDDITALRRLAAVRLSQNGAKNFNDELVALADRLIKIPGGAAIGYTLKGVVYHNDGSPETAVGSFERVLELDPELRLMPLPPREFWTYLADDLLAIGRAADARRYLVRATAQSADPVLLNRLGMAYQQEGAVDEAQRCWRQAIERDPRAIPPLVNLGRLELQRNRLDDAQTHLRRALELDPDDRQAVYALSQIYRRLDRKADAERLLKDALERWRKQASQPGDPRSVPAHAL